MTGIQGKVVAITGASSGIGEATALLLAGRGARVVLGARRVDRLEALAARIADAGGAAADDAGGAAAGGAAAFMRVDVRRQDDVAGLTALACERFGRLDVLISNAGVGLNSPLDDLRVADWEEMLDSNVKGVLYGIAAALPLFRAQGSGHFVNTLSTSGLRIVPNQVVYAASKNAARAISEGLRQEAGESIRVTTVSPGFIGTDFAAGTVDPAARADLLARRDKIAIPADAVARAIAFAIEQPADVDVNEIVIRPTAQA
jgi:NADP-dependent 3-hydroxy acid dehydrogenase YdfG